MNLDFTYEKLRTLYDTLLSEDLRPVTLLTYLKEKPQKNKCVIIRHDVDRNVRNALNIAKIENNWGISSSYYFRYPSTFNIPIISEIHKIGHEIGYHYEVLAKTGGDYYKAINLFKKELFEFRKISDVKTICAHGSPISSWDNRDLWKKFNLVDYGLIGDAHLSLPTDICYFSDTGRSWDMQANIRDTLQDQKIFQQVHSTDDLIEYISLNHPKLLYLVIHPERWNEQNFSWYSQLFADIVFNMGRKVIRKLR